jgi:hypothetical protein
VILNVFKVFYMKVINVQLLVNNRSDENNGLGESELLKGDK